jgi:biotin carboxylase
LEIANRGGGVHTASKIIPAISGINISELLIRQALGQGLPFPLAMNKVQRSALLTFFIFSPGFLEGILGVEEVKAHPGVLHLHFLVQEETYIAAPRSAGERHGFLITVGDTPDQARQAAAEARRLLRPVYRPGAEER